MVCLETSKEAANSSCVTPCALRISSSRFFKWHLLGGKFALHFEHNTERGGCQVSFPFGRCDVIDPGCLGFDTFRESGILANVHKNGEEKLGISAN